MASVTGPSFDLGPGDAVPALFHQTAREHGERTAVICGDRRSTFSELSSRVYRCANALIALGVRRGDRVALLSRNSLEAVEVFFGALTAGACIVPLPTMARAEQLELMMRDSRSKVLVVSSDLAPLAGPLVEGLPLLPGGAIGFGTGDGRLMDYEAWLEPASEAPPGVSIRGEDEFNIIYSSGTTGVPKGIVHTHAMRVAFTRGTAAFGFGPDAVTLVSTPLYSNTTMTAWLPSMAFGATSVLMPKFDAREFLELSSRHRVTHAMLVPTQYDRILRQPGLGTCDLSSYRVKLSTSAPLRADLKRQILDRWPGMLVEIYGLTEGGVSTVLVANANPDKLNSVGQPTPGCELKVIDDAGNELPPGQAGELVGRSPIMMKGYENRDEATREMLWHDAQGNTYLRSGDIGRIDEAGFVYLLDRKKDMVISGGFNVYATDLENVLLEHEAVHEAAVIGVPHADWGETPVGMVVLEPGASTTAEAIRQWANARLGKGQRLSEVVVREELPKSAIGKVLKRELREGYDERRARHEP